MRRRPRPPWSVILVAVMLVGSGILGIVAAIPTPVGAGSSGSSGLQVASGPPPMPYIENSVLVPMGPFFTDYLDAPGGTTEHPASGGGEWGVANYDAGEFTILNGSTQAITHVIVVTDNPLGVEADDQTQTFWVTLSTGDNVSVISSTGHIVKTLPVGTTPIRLCYDRAQQRYFVMNSGSDNITVINSTTYAHVTDITTWDGSPFGCAFNDFTDTLLVSNDGTNTVSAYNGRTMAFIGNVTGGDLADFQNPATVAGDSTTQDFYVANFGSNVETVVGLSNMTAWRNITSPGCASPYGSGIDYITNQVYVACWGSSEVMVISISNESWFTTLPMATGATPYGLHGYNPNQGEMMVAANGISQVTFIADGTGGCANGTNSSFCGGGGGGGNGGGGGGGGGACNGRPYCCAAFGDCPPGQNNSQNGTVPLTAPYGYVGDWFFIGIVAGMVGGLLLYFGKWGFGGAGLAAAAILLFITVGVMGCPQHGVQACLQPF